MKYILIFMLFYLNLFASSEIEGSVVKIYTVSKMPNYITPWNSSIRHSHGSGSIISGNRILTNAHVVANETFIEVKKDGDTKKYEAEIEFISHQADLALLKLKDESFFEGTIPLKFDSLPKFEQDIAVYGFPVGGDSLSVSRGIVSRIEHNIYAHSRESFLAIQIDAAVNPGSSGGPAISNGKILGVVMQQISDSQNIGYIVPVEIIKHFLDDVSDGKYDGFAHIGIITQMMENEALRAIYKMDKDLTGALVVDISQKSNAYKQLKKDDVLLSVDGHTIQNDATVEFIKHKYTSYQYYIDKKQIGDSISFDILRDGKRLKVEFTLNTMADDNLLVNTIEHDTMPKYFIYGGYVFVPLTRNILMQNRSVLLNLREASNEWASDKKEEAVILLKVLASPANRGDHNLYMWMVDKINAKKFKNFAQFVEMINNFNGKYLILEDKEFSKIVIDCKKAIETNEMILRRYSIKNSRRF
jgi:S1-C subfamily serine protease